MSPPMQCGVILFVLLGILQSCLHVSAVITAHRLRRRARKYPEHGICFEFGKFYNARMPLISGDATLVWTQGPLPTPPWGGWLTASDDALLPGLANPRHAVFAVLNAKYLSLYNAEYEAIACKLPAAAIPTDRILTAKLKRNMGYLTEVFRLRRPNPLGQVWCIEVVATHDDLEPIKTPKAVNSTNTTSGGNHSNSSRVERALNIEDLPLCFPTQELQLQWLRALQSIGRIDRKNLAPFSDSMTDILLRPEFNIGPRAPFFPLPERTICAEDGLWCLEAVAPPPPPPTTTNPDPLVSVRIIMHGHAFAAPMRYASSMPITTVDEQRWTVSSVDNQGTAMICLSGKSRRAMRIKEEMCLGVEKNIRVEGSGPIPPRNFRACRLPEGSPDTPRSCFPIDSLTLGNNQSSIKAAKPCQEACDEEENCERWTYHRAGTWNHDVASCCLFFGEEGRDFTCADDAPCCITGTPKSKVRKFKTGVPLSALQDGTPKYDGGLTLAPRIVLGRRGLWRIVEDTPETTTKAPIPGTNTTTPPLPPPKPRAFALQLAENNNLCLTTTRFPHSDPEPNPELDFLMGRTHQNTTTTPMPGKQPLWLARCGSGIVRDTADGFRERPLQQTWLMEGFNIAEEGLSTDQLIRERQTTRRPVY